MLMHTMLPFERWPDDVVDGSLWCNETLKLFGVYLS